MTLIARLCKYDEFIVYPIVELIFSIELHNWGVKLYATSNKRGTQRLGTLSFRDVHRSMDT